MRPRVVVVVLLLVGLAGAWLVCNGEESGKTTSGGESAAGGDEAAAGLSSHITPSEGFRRIPRWFGQPEARARRIAGRVVQDGAPVAGAEVRLSSELFSAGFAPEPRIQTDGDGRFDFGRLPAATYQVTATAPERTPIGRRVDLRDPTARPAPDQLELRLRACRARVIGLVEDASGGPIAGATVRVSARSSLSSATTDDDGAFALCVPAGASNAVVRADGYGTLMRSLYVVGRTPATFELTPAATVTGRVELDGEPVANAQVSARGERYRNPATGHEQTLTDASGAFTLDTLAAGRYSLRASSDSGRSEPVQVVLRTGEVTSEIVLALEPTVTLRGVVMANGAPVSGARIWASPPMNSFIQFNSGEEAISQDDGTFILAGLSPGEYELRSSSHEIVTPRQIDVLDGASDQTVEVEVALLATIRGRVLRGGEPVADALVSTRGHRTTSDGTGAFTLSGLAAGEHSLYAEALRVGAFTREVAVEVEKGATVEGIDLVLDLEASIAGRVIDEQGQPVPGAYLSFIHEDRQDFGRATTSADGSFLATAMSGGGNYSVTIQRSPSAAMPLVPARGSEFAAVTLAGPASQVTDVEFVVSSAAHRIAGRVERQSGAPVPDALIQIFSRSVRSSNSSLPRVMSDVEGTFEFQKVSAGDYRLFASLGEGTRSQNQNVTVPGNGDLVIVLPDTGSVEGELVGFTGSVRVTLQQARGNQRYDVRAAQGRFRLDEVATGTYQVIASNAGEAETAEVTVAASEVAQVRLESQGSGAIQGRLMDFDSGRPLPGHACAWNKMDSRARRSASSTGRARTDDSGAFTLSAPVGTVTLHCYDTTRRGQRDAQVSRPTLEIRADQTTSVTLYSVTSETPGFRIDVGLYLDHRGEPKILHVQPGSSAERGGLQRGDRVVAVNGADVTMLEGPLILQLLARHVGGRAAITVERNGQQHTVEIPIERRERR